MIPDSESKSASLGKAEKRELMIPFHWTPPTSSSSILSLFQVPVLLDRPTPSLSCSLSHFLTAPVLTRTSHVFQSHPLCYGHRSTFSLSSLVLSLPLPLMDVSWLSKRVEEKGKNGKWR